MSKIAHYLQEHLLGEVLVSSNVRRYFAIDGSIFTITHLSTPDRHILLSDTILVPFMSYIDDIPVIIRVSGDGIF